MKLYIRITVAILLFSLSIQAQTTITGTVKDSLNISIPYTSVYLLKTTIGALTDAKGAFTLTIPEDGLYEMIFSSVGYESFSQIITANGLKQIINIKLPKKTIKLNEFTVNEKDKNREKHYRQFVASFIGRTPNSYSCKIYNPRDLYIYRDYRENTLKAYSINPLKIENKALGYTIMFDLKEFNYNIKTGHLRYSGYSYFKLLNGNPKQVKRWERNRLIAYYGSRTHFLRALFEDSLSHENFKLAEFKLDNITEDWSAINPIKVEHNIAINKTSLSIIHDKKMLISYNYPDSLKFNYSSELHRSSIIFNDSLKVFKNGNCDDLYHVTWGGEMAEERLADMLPIDFDPKKKK